jgi:ATP-dependent DNA ligase
MGLPDFAKPRDDMFIQSQHPKNGITPEAEHIRGFLELNWIGQAKMNGHRLQIHISPKGQMTCFTRQGNLHTKKLSTELEASFLQYADKDGILVLDCEWIKSLDQVWLFDVLKYQGRTMMFSSYKERYGILKSIYAIAANIKLSRVLKKEKDCLKVLADPNEIIEGLVLKAWETKGWPDTAIVRCLKQK